MAEYSLPPWISQPADPAAHFATGLQIGARMGAEQAAQQYQQQQLLREQQKDEFEKQYKNTLLNMQIDQAVRKQRAISSYHQMVQGGTDPMQALMQVGPEMGEGLNELMRTQAMAEAGKLRAKTAQDMATIQQQRMAMADKRLQSQEKEKEADRASRDKQKEADRVSREKVQSDNRALRAQMAIGKDAELKSLTDGLETAKLQLDMGRKAQSKWFGAPGKDQLQALEKTVTESQAAIDKRRRELMQEYGGAQASDAQGSDEEDHGDAPAQAPAATPQLKVGQRVKQGGKMWIYKGGDTTDPQSFDEDTGS